MGIFLQAATHVATAAVDTANSIMAASARSKRIICFRTPYQRWFYDGYLVVALVVAIFFIIERFIFF